MKSLSILLVLVAANLSGQDPSPTEGVEGLITTSTLSAPLRFLSHDLLEGRGMGSRGDDLSQLFIETQFRFAGLEPGGPGGSFRQEVPIVSVKSKVLAPLTARGTDNSLSFQDPDDYTFLAGRPDLRSAWKDLELVFVGYGITAPEQKWDDFKDTDVKDKVLLVMNNDPSSDPELFAGKTRLYYGRWSYKYEEAARRGAAGVIIIHTTPSAGYPFQVIQSGHGQEHFWLPFEADQPTLDIRAWCSEDAAKKLAALGHHDLDALRAQAEERTFRPVNLGVKVSLSAENTVREFKSGNVIGRLPGSDPALKDEVVIMTAHFDHLGIGPAKNDDIIYNGALDNASGTAAMLSIMKACAALPTKPRRTILFAAVTGEESGLLGSLYYARNPTVPVKNIIANFNIDGINIWGPTRDLSVVGYGKNDLTALAGRVAGLRGRELVANPEVDKGLFYRSDHFSFARVGVPSIYFKAGREFLERGEARRRVMAMYTNTRYHQPSDEFDDRWNLEGAVQDVQLMLECMVRTANAETAPKWTPGDEFEKLR